MTRSNRNELFTERVLVGFSRAIECYAMESGVQHFPQWFSDIEVRRYPCLEKLSHQGYT